MRIAVVTTSYPRAPGDAAGHFVAEEVRRLEAVGHAVVVIAPEPWVMAFGWPGVAARVAEAPHRLFGAAGWIGRARRRLRDEGPWDRVVAHWVVPCAWPIALSVTSPLEVVSHGGDVRLLSALPAVLRGRLVATLTRRADSWRFVAPHLVENLSRGLSAPRASALRAKSVIAPAAMASLDRAGLEARIQRLHDQRGGRPYAVAVGRLVASKRFSAAIARAEALDLDLIIVGDGPDRARLEAFGAGRPRGTVSFLGQLDRDEALAWIAGAAVLLHPSRTEGCSTVVREAEALGVPVDRCAGALGSGGPPGSR